MKQPLNNPNEKEDRARLVLAIVLSLLILFGFNHFFDKPKMEEARRKAEITAQQKTTVAVKKETEILPREAALKQSARVPVKGSKITGSLSLKGARLDDLTLNDHFKTVERKEPVELLSPSGAAQAFYAESGWIADSGATVPSAETVWTLAARSPREIASGKSPVVLQWDNGQGLLFEKTVALDDNYLFTVTDRVTNNSGAEIKLNAYQLVARHGLPEGYSGFFVLHEGPVGYLGGKRHEPDYDDLTDGEKLEMQGTSGWVGITDKYWMAAILPDASATFDARVIGTGEFKRSDHYQADLVFPAATLAAGKSAESTGRFYAGVKNLDVMKAYEKVHGIKNLELGIDFGMWSFITKPFYFLLHYLSAMTGNIAIAILLMTVIVRAGVFPLASKSFRSMARMKVLAPKLKELQEKFSSDKAKLQMEIYDLYKRENVNPMSGCWPMLIQIPIFFALYKVILISVELRHAPFWGWIKDLSAPDPTSLFNLFGLIPWDPPSILMIGVWPCLYCFSMVLQMRLSPPAPDPTQQTMQDMMPYVFSIMLAQFASGLVIYWTWSNVLGILQQYYILRKFGTDDVSLLRGHSARHKKKKEKALKPVSSSTRPR